ncbi:MAG: putative molybdenum carrier protein, partial [Deltaproteobacteria bacterium]|nr:putative molybdenum carrier protein [Deltaproteobacteria bacterium]
MNLKIVSGGQTGVDRAALDAAIEVGLPYGGIIPKNRLAEDGKVPEKYQLTESDNPTYEYRTEQNVIHSDATLILGYLPMTGGTSLTNDFCHKHAKPHLFIDLKQPHPKQKILDWIKTIQPKVLNIAGP